MQLCDVRKKNKGFTLIEILVAAILIGIVSAISAPNLFAFFINANVTDAVGDIEGAMKEAQARAKRLGRTCNLILVNETVGSDLRVAVRPDPADPANIPCLPEARTSALGVTQANNFGGNMTYSSRGNIGGAGPWIIQVTHANASRDKCILVSGIFGDIQNGIYQDDGDGSLDGDDCRIVGD